MSLGFTSTTRISRDSPGILDNSRRKWLGRLGLYSAFGMVKINAAVPQGWQTRSAKSYLPSGRAAASSLDFILPSLPFSVWDAMARSERASFAPGADKFS